MGILDEIAKGGSQFTPITAFLVGRENRLNRERQTRLDQRQLNIDAQGKINDQVLNDFRRAQTAALKAPEKEKLDQDVVEFIQVTGTQRSDPKFGEKFVAYKQSLKGPAPSTHITMPPAEKAGSIELAKLNAKGVSERNKAAQLTFSSDAKLARIEQAIARGAQTGRGEEFILDLKGLGATIFGIDFKESDDEAEVIRKISNEMALEMRNPDAGLGLPGSISNKDLDFLKAAVAGLQRSEAGNLKIIEYSRRINKFKRDVAAEQARIIGEAGGSIPHNIDARVIAFANDYQFFTPEERAEVEALLKSGPESKSLINRAGEVLSGESSDQDVLDAILSR
jgi:hypothetical protein